MRRVLLCPFRKHVRAPPCLSRACAVFFYMFLQSTRRVALRAFAEHVSGPILFVYRQGAELNYIFVYRACSGLSELRRSMRTDPLCNFKEHAWRSTMPFYRACARVPHAFVGTQNSYRNFGSVYQRWPAVARWWPVGCPRWPVDRLQVAGRWPVGGPLVARWWPAVAHWWPANGQLVARW